MISIDVAYGLLTVDTLRELAVQECILDIELMHRPATGSREREDNADGAWFNDRGEGLVEVDPRSLVEAADNPPSLASFQRPIRIKLVFKNPLAGDDVRAWWSGNKIPRPVALESCELFLHRVEPSRVA